MKALLGTKKRMEQVFVDAHRVPVTVIQAGPCIVTQIKTVDTDGYSALQLGFSSKSLKNVTKPLQGHLKGAIKDKKAPRFLAEVSVDSEHEYKVGDEITLSDVFTVGDVVSVTGTSKGKGFQGVIKRWNFSGGNRSHGQHGTGRSPGSIGQGTDPGRVWKGKKMGGRMGGKTSFVSNLKVISIDKEMNEIAISGTVPGGPGGFLVVECTKKAEPQNDAQANEGADQDKS